MINLENMNRQHAAIMNEVCVIEEEIKKEKDNINYMDIALHINRLAGQLKMHLLEEDKYLYPDLLKCKDKEVQAMAQQYISEMGNLDEAYTAYKVAFNVSSKIKMNKDLFISETKKTMDALRKRMDKENQQLYRIIVERKL